MNGKEMITLTKREQTILKAVALGRTTPQIAADLSLSPETVKWYRKQLLNKLSAATSAQMVRLAIENKLI